MLTSELIHTPVSIMTDVVTYRLRGTVKKQIIDKLHACTVPQMPLKLTCLLAPATKGRSDFHVSSIFASERYSDSTVSLTC